MQAPTFIQKLKPPLQACTVTSGEGWPDKSQLDFMVRGIS